MGRVTTTAALVVALATSAVATPSRRFPRNSPKETKTANIEVGGLFGWSPMPTQAPMGPPADPSLDKRYDKGSDTCGFAEGFASDPWTCFAVGATCSVWSGYLGCCATTGICSSSMLTACVPWSDVQEGSCARADANTLCCTDSYPSCFTWTSTTSTDPDNTVTGFNCLAIGGTAALFEQPPGLSSTTGDDDDPETTATSDTTDATSDATSTDDLIPTDAPGSNGDDSSNDTSDSDSDSNSGGGAPIGAIVGGVVGGLALIALGVLAAGIIIWRKRKAKNAPVPVQQQQPPTGYSVVPGGMPPPQMGYDPRMSLINPPQGGDPYHNGYYGYNPSNASPSTHTGSVYVAPGHTPPPPGQQGLWVGQQNTGSTAPGHTSPPPGQQGSWVGQQSTGSTAPGQPFQQGPAGPGPQELGTDTIVGSKENRAELS